MADEVLTTEQHINKVVESVGVTLPTGLVTVLLSGGEKALLAGLVEVGAKVGTVNFGSNNALIQNVITVGVKLLTQYLNTPTPAPIVPPAPHVPVVPTEVPVNVA